MKRFVFSLLSLPCFLHYSSFAQEQNKDTMLMQPLEVKAIRVSDNLPVAKTTLDKVQIQKNNTGVDLPFIMNQTPSIQANSDGGNGVGYTGLRIRGTDATRINFTINGIPYNDAESQGTFLVNLPDIASSANSIQIQRGVGSSTNGSGAFGASVNISTNENDTEKSIQFNNSFGSYNTLKNTLLVNSGLLKKHFIFSGRLSQISSDGYVDRAKTKLQSFFTSAAYLNKNYSLRLNVFSGKEKTYAAWFGINESALDTNRTYNPAGTEKSGTPYDNETDNYTQTHYQFFYNQQLSSKLKYNIALFTTTGKGYFEQYKANQSLSNYYLPNYINGTDTVTSVNLVRQLWLDNIFYGTVFSLHYSSNKNTFLLGGNLNNYKGKHFGQITQSETPGAIPDNFRWYNLNANKNEQSVYVKWIRKINNNWETYVDLQSRNVNYKINGFRANPNLTVDNKFHFINPKAGVTYQKSNKKIYFSYSSAQKEPNRDDFETSSTDAPKPETLHDFELGMEKKSGKFSWAINTFYMYYRNQLVLTGEVNDVFAYTRKNIDKSYRAGIEMEGNVNINSKITLLVNLSLSTNRAINFNEFIDQYDENFNYLGQKEISYKKTDLAFSPSVVGSCILNIIPLKNTEISFIGKYVGEQFLDNTSNASRALPSYYTQDLRINYLMKSGKKFETMFFLQGNNIFSQRYVANGYTFSYLVNNNLSTENYFFPMATFNVMGGINIKL